MPIRFKREIYHLLVSLVYFDAVIMQTGGVYKEQTPFYVRFTGEDSVVAFVKDHVTLGVAVNLCVKLCEEHWWCNSLRKCADGRLSFRCDVTCRLRKWNGIPKSVDQKCLIQETNRIGPNVAAHQDVGLIYDSAHVQFKERYATDTVTICPVNSLFLHTHFVPNPWVKIFFNQTVDVAAVVVYNRQVVCGDRFHDVLIQVDDGHDWRTCGFYKGPGESYQIIFIICNGVVRGDALLITIQSQPNVKDAINLCEVEVFEKI